MRLKLFLLVMLLCLGSLSRVEAATIRVAKDGTGDFDVIYDAVAAAASGDTISIAPGEYTETREHVYPGGTTSVVAAPTQSELTIIGDDAESVLIGKPLPEPDPNLSPYFGIKTTTSGNVRLRSLTLQNLRNAFDEVGDWATVKDCRFIGNFIGVVSVVTDHIEIRNSQFLEQADAAIVLFRGRGASGDVIADCDFIDNGIGPDIQTEDALVERCSMQGGVLGMQISLGGIATVRDCHFEGFKTGLVISNSQGYVYDCVFEAGMLNNVTVAGLLAGSGNELLGGTSRTLGFSWPAISQFHGNHIINGGEWSVHTASRYEPLTTLNLSGNYWGTTDTAQLDEWIWDHNDDSRRESFIVDYSPLAETPIPTEKTSFGELKACYGGNE